MDFADRLEVMREAPKDRGRAAQGGPPAKPAPKTEVEARSNRPEPNPNPIARCRSSAEGAQTSIEIIPPETTPRPRASGLCRGARGRGATERAGGSPNAPNDLIDLAQRYASTLKPPQSMSPSPSTRFIPRRRPSHRGHPPPEPMVMPDRSRTARNEGLSGWGWRCLPFRWFRWRRWRRLWKRAPSSRPVPFFGLPPALGLTTSLVWRWHRRLTPWRMAGCRHHPIPRLGRLRDFEEALPLKRYPGRLRRIGSLSLALHRRRPMPVGCELGASAPCTPSRGCPLRPTVASS